MRTPDQLNARVSARCSPTIHCCQHGGGTYVRQPCCPGATAQHVEPRVVTKNEGESDDIVSGRSLLRATKLYSGGNAVSAVTLEREDYAYGRDLLLQVHPHTIICSLISRDFQLSETLLAKASSAAASSEDGVPVSRELCEGVPLGSWPAQHWQILNAAVEAPTSPSLRTVHSWLTETLEHETI